MSESIDIFCPRSLRLSWPEPLVDQWCEQYPCLFDELDRGMPRKDMQRARHFKEWLAAIHLFHSRGVCSLVEKYTFGKHDRQCRVLERGLGPGGVRSLIDVCEGLGVQAPDLYLDDLRSGRAVGFVEVKGEDEPFSDEQRDSHSAIADKLALPVEVARVIFVETSL